MSTQPYVQSVFQDLNDSFNLGYCDVSFEKVVNRRYQTKSTLPNDVIEFCIPHTKAPYVFLMRDCFFDFEVTLTAKDRTKLRVMPNITVVNNLMHSLFTSLDMKLNNTVIGIDYNYCYKAYLVNLITYDSMIKNSQLRTEGWSTDTYKEFQLVSSNAGYVGKNLGIFLMLN